jgi:hypothetical protein
MQLEPGGQVLHHLGLPPLRRPRRPPEARLSPTSDSTSGKLSTSTMRPPFDSAEPEPIADLEFDQGRGA